MKKLKMMKARVWETGVLALLVAHPVQANLCDGQVTVLLQRTAQEVSPKLSEQQLQQLRVISLELCQSRSAVQGEASEPPKGFDDWFSYFMLTKQPEKAGNKRLKHLKR